MDLQPAFLVFGFIVLITILLIICYGSLRHNFPVRASCWFCSEVSKIPYGNRNCWDCPKCEQYNGFTKDGDYNKSIPAQYDNSLNHNTGCQTGEFLTFNKQLCNKCNNSLHLKARLLADFQPTNKAKFDEEIKLHSQRLDSWYDICMDCHMIVQQELQKQDAMLAWKLKSHDTYSSADTCSSKFGTETKGVKNRRKVDCPVVFEMIAVCCLLLLALRSVHIFLEYTSIDFSGLDILWIFIDSSSTPLIEVVGFVGAVISKCIILRKYRLHLVDLGSIILWIVMLLPQFIFIEWSNDICDLYIVIAILVFSLYSTIVIRHQIPRPVRVNRYNIHRGRVKEDNSYNSDSVNKKTKESESIKSQKQGDINGCLDDTLTGLEAFTFGTPVKKGIKTGIFSSSFSSTETTYIFPSKLSPSRPLISPAKLKIMKFSKENTEGSPKFTQVKSPLRFSAESSNITSENLLTVSSSALAKKLSQVTTDGNDTDSEESRSSRSSICPVDSTTKADAEVDKGFITNRIRSREGLYMCCVFVMMISFGLNLYFLWFR